MAKKKDYVLLLYSFPFCPSLFSFTYKSLPFTITAVKAVPPFPQITQDFLDKDSITVYFAPSVEECKGEEGKRG